MSKNYIIYHKDNRTLQLTNHFDPDGDLDPNYIRLRNIALTGKIVNGKFESKYPKKFEWLIECAKTKSRNKHDNRTCTICGGIFKDAPNGDYTITDFYIEKVVKPQMIEEEKREKRIEKKKQDAKELYSKSVKFLKSKVNQKQDKDKHPLYDAIVAKFTKGE